MKININIEVSPSELIELQDAIHESAREAVTKLSSEGIAHKVLEHLEEASNQEAYHIPADHMETGTVIQGKPTREPEAAEPEYRVGDLVELPWEKNGCGLSDRLFSITELCDDDTVSLREINSFPVFTMTNIPKSWIRRPRIKVDLTGDEEWITPGTADPHPTPPRPMRDPGTRIQTGDHVIVQPFTGYNEIFTVLAANNGRALLLGEIGEEETQELSNLLPVWPDSEGNYCFHRNDTAAEPPEE